MFIIVKVNVVSRSPSNPETLHVLSAKRLKKKKKSIIQSITNVKMTNMIKISIGKIVPKGIRIMNIVVINWWDYE